MFNRGGYPPKHNNPAQSPTSSVCSDDSMDNAETSSTCSDEELFLPPDSPINNIPMDDAPRQSTSYNIPKLEPQSSDFDENVVDEALKCHDHSQNVSNLWLSSMM